MASKFDPELVASAESAGLCPNRLQRLDDFYQSYIDEGKLAGASVLIARHSNVAHLATYGMADIEKGRPIAEDTIFRIASMTKPVTSLAVLRLAEEGRLLLNDPIQAYLPEFKDGKVLEEVPDSSDAFRLVDVKRPMTIRHLLTHTSGLIYEPDPAIDGPLSAFYQTLKAFYDVANLNCGLGGWETLERAMHRFGKLPLAFHPGDRWEYGYSIDVLGRLIEVVSGMTLDQYFKTRFFEPLQMNDTDFRLPPEKVDRLATLYIKAADGSLQPYQDDPYVPEPYDPSLLFLAGGGGLTSTITDYARFLQMTLNGGELNGERILSPRSIELALANHIGDLNPWDMPGFKFGLGFQIHTDPGLSGSPKSVGSYDWGGWWHTIFWVDPAKEMFAIKMSQYCPDVWPEDPPDDFWPYPVDHPKLRHLTYQALLD